MIPAPFEYVRVGSVEEAVAVLGQHGDEAKILAGGHSLIPLLRLRLADPQVLVDASRVEELRGVREQGDDLVIGAMTTHHEIVHDPLVRQHCGILSQATATVGDPQVRHRGTIGGAVAHGDPAGDLPAVVLALDATMVAQGPDGRREIAAVDFFSDYLETSLQPEEVLTALRVPKLGPGWGFDYQKFHRVAQAWAIVGVCAIVGRDNGAVGEARVGLTHMGTTPLRAAATEAALAGVDASAIPAAAEQAADGTTPPADLNAQPDYRAELARVLTRRALERAVRG